MQWEVFFPHVLPYVQGCPEPTAQAQLILAAREFCRRTLVWNYECTPIKSTKDLATYVFQIDEGQELVRLLGMTVDGRDYDVPNASKGRRAVRQGQTGRMAFLQGPSEFVLSPAPWQSDLDIVADVCVKPSLKAEEWPDDLEEHLDDLVHGAISNLSLIPGQPWTDAAQAGTSRARFLNRINTVAMKVAKGFGTSAQRRAGTYF